MSPAVGPPERSAPAKRRYEILGNWRMMLHCSKFQIKLHATFCRSGGYLAGGHIGHVQLPPMEERSKWSPCAPSMLKVKSRFANPMPPIIRQVNAPKSDDSAVMIPLLMRAGRLISARLLRLQRPPRTSHGSCKYPIRSQRRWWWLWLRRRSPFIMQKDMVRSSNIHPSANGLHLQR